MKPTEPEERDTYFDRYCPPDHILFLSRTLITLGLTDEAEQVVEMQKTYERSLNYYHFLASKL